MKPLLGLCALMLALASQPSFALSPAGESSLRQIQTRWAEINYQTPEAQRETAFARLASEAESAVIGEPQAAELHIWHGIVLSTWAGAKGGLGALGLVKQAKAELEKAIELDPAALDGSAYTSLASLLPGARLADRLRRRRQGRGAVQTGAGAEPGRHRPQLLPR